MRQLWPSPVESIVNQGHDIAVALDDAESAVANTPYASGVSSAIAFAHQGFYHSDRAFKIVEVKEAGSAFVELSICSDAYSKCYDVLIQLRERPFSPRVQDARVKVRRILLDIGILLVELKQGNDAVN